MKTKFSGKRAYGHLDVLCEEIGPRHGGSTKEAQAARYICDYFKSLGLKAKLEKYPLYSFEDATASLKGSDGKEISCIPLPMTKSTPARGLTKSCVFIGEAAEVNLDKSIRDKIVIMFGSFNGELQKKFHSYNPAALVSIQTRPNLKPLRSIYSAKVNRKNGSIPTVILSLEDGVALVDKHPETLTVKVATLKEKLTTGYSVVADLKGSGSDDDIFVVCAHFDSVWGGAGAVDNGGGAASMMELARVYKENGSPRNLRFIAFGGEELGVLGAAAYVKKLKDKDLRLKKDKNFERDGLKSELDHIRFIINLDIMGQVHGITNIWTLGHSDIAASARLLANERRYAVTLHENDIYSSDNQMFNYAGVPGISFNRCGYDGWGCHTDEDTIKHCSPAGLDHTGAMIEAWIERYLITPHAFPFTRSLPDAAKNALDKWYKGNNPLDYEVFSPVKKYKPTKKNR